MPTSAYNLVTLLNPFAQAHFQLITALAPNVACDQLRQRLAAARPYRTWPSPTAPQEHPITGTVTGDQFHLRLAPQRPKSFPTDLQGTFRSASNGSTIFVRIGLRPWMAATLAIPLGLIIIGMLRGLLLGFFNSDTLLQTTPLFPLFFLLGPVVLILVYVYSRWQMQRDHQLLLGFLQETLAATLTETQR